MRDYFPIGQQLDLGNLVTRVEHSPSHDRVNVVQKVVANKVHCHAYRRQGRACRSILKHHATDRRIFVYVLKRLQGYPLV